MVGARKIDVSKVALERKMINTGAMIEETEGSR